MNRITRFIFLSSLSLFVSITYFGQGNRPVNQQNNVRRPTITRTQHDSPDKVADERLPKDWAFLKKYSDENKNLPAVASGEKRIVFMGNSITEFWKSIDSDLFTKNKIFY
jgi:hypothetical protein